MVPASLTTQEDQGHMVYLEGSRAGVLPADGVSVVGPHDLVDPVALGREGLLWGHHA